MPENQNIEWKSKWKDDYLEWICGYANAQGVYYYRSGSTRQTLTGPVLEAFLMRKRGATWDNLPLPAFSLNDVDDTIVERFKQWASKKGRIDRSVLDEKKAVLMEKLHLMNKLISDQCGNAPVFKRSREMAA